MNQSEVTTKELSQPVGLNSFLPKEYGSKMCPLQMLKYDEQEVHYNKRLDCNFFFHNYHITIISDGCCS